MSDPAADLLRRITLGEDTYLECKRVVIVGKRVTGPNADALSDEIAAMANARGGTIVFGIDDKTHEVLGLPIEHLDRIEDFLRETLRDRIKPEITDLVLERLELPDVDDVERPVIRLDVERSLFVHRSRNGYFHRVGSAKREMSPSYLERMLAQRSQSGLLHYDETPVHCAAMSDFSPPLVARFRTSTGAVQEPEEVLLDKLGMATRDGEGRRRPTLAGVLLGCDKPESLLPHAYIQAVAYRGTTADAGPGYQLDAADLGGPLDEQVAGACRFVARNMTVAASKEVGREDHPQFDMTAVFEAVVNAVAHRDYSIAGSKIRLRLFADRLELCVPGSLVNSLELGDLAYQQHSRNPVITGLLARVPVPGGVAFLETGRTTLMDRRGEGVPLVLQRGERVSGRVPLYELDGDSQLRLTLWGRPRG